MTEALRYQIRLLKHAGHSYAKIDRLLELPPGTSCGAIHDKLTKDDSRVCEYCGKTVRKIHRHTINYATGQYKRACSTCHAKQHYPNAKARAAKTSRLTPREQECVDHILSGKRNWETAKLMGCSLRTVEKHRMSVYGKLGVTSGIELALKVSQNK